jgi:toxin FitB
MAQPQSGWTLPESASFWGRIAALRSRGDIDGLIAATAIVHDLILVTRNVRDFEDIAVSLINPWSRE